MLRNCIVLHITAFGTSVADRVPSPVQLKALLSSPGLSWSCRTWSTPGHNQEMLEVNNPKGQFFATGEQKPGTNILAFHSSKGQF